VSKPLDGYTQYTQTVAALERAHEAGHAPQPGQDIEYVVVDDDRTSRDRVALAHEEIDRTIVTRLVETISWSATVPIRDQSPVDLSDVAQGEPAEPDAESQSCSTAGDDSGEDEAPEPNEDQGTEAPGTAMADGSGAVDESAGNDKDDQETTSPDADGESESVGTSANPWAPTGDGYRVRGANSARLYREENQSGDWDVFAESDSGVTYRLHEGLGSLEAGELLTRLSKVVSPVTIERGGESGRRGERGVTRWRRVIRRRIEAGADISTATVARSFGHGTCSGRACRARCSVSWMCETGSYVEGGPSAVSAFETHEGFRVYAGRHTSTPT
jgi:hypothetical protein